MFLGTSAGALASLGVRQCAFGISLVVVLGAIFRLPLAERRRRVAELAALDADDLAALDGGLAEDCADDLIENVIGRLALPLAIATNFTIDGRDVLVPMAIEEPSVVAAASNGARMIRAGGGFTSDVSPASTPGV